MPPVEKTVRVYQELADYYDRQRQPPVRDRFLVLAADAALAAGQREEAERVRSKLLHLNPHHLLKPFASLAEAMQSPDVGNYIAGLRRTYPPESAESLLASLRSGNETPPAPAEEADTQAARPAPDAYRLQGEPAGSAAAPASKSADPWGNIPGVVASRTVPAASSKPAKPSVSRLESLRESAAGGARNSRRIRWPGSAPDYSGCCWRRPWPWGRIPSRNHFCRSKSQRENGGQTTPDRQPSAYSSPKSPACCRFPGLFPGCRVTSVLMNAIETCRGGSSLCGLSSSDHQGCHTPNCGPAYCGTHGPHGRCRGSARRT